LAGLRRFFELAREFKLIELVRDLEFTR